MLIMVIWPGPRIAVVTGVSIIRSIVVWRIVLCGIVLRWIVSGIAGVLRRLLSSLIAGLVMRRLITSLVLVVRDIFSDPGIVLRWLSLRWKHGWRHGGYRKGLWWSRRHRCLHRRIGVHRGTDRVDSDLGRFLKPGAIEMLISDIFWGAMMSHWNFGRVKVFPGEEAAKSHKTDQSRYSNTETGFATSTQPFGTTEPHCTIQIGKIGGCTDYKNGIFGRRLGFDLDFNFPTLGSRNKKTSGRT
jgi:hypothetical protein